MERETRGRSLKWNGYAVLFCSILFFSVYGGTTYYSKNFADAESFVFEFEKEIPFISWMLIPYMSSGLFFAMVFFWCRTKTQLKIYTLRFALATVVAGICFVIFPLKHSFERPQTNNEAVLSFEKFIELFDSPYNQAPSLHVTYAVLYWTVVKVRFDGLTKWLIAVWLLLMIISTVFVYQHHIIDLISGLFLAVFCLLVLKIK